MLSFAGCVTVCFVSSEPHLLENSTAWPPGFRKLCEAVGTHWRMFSSPRPSDKTLRLIVLVPSDVWLATTSRRAGASRSDAVSSLIWHVDLPVAVPVAREESLGTQAGD